MSKLVISSVEAEGAVVVNSQAKGPKFDETLERAKATEEAKFTEQRVFHTIRRILYVLK